MSMKQCGLCAWKTNDAEAFAKHMQDAHGWGSSGPSTAKRSSNIGGCIVIAAVILIAAGVLSGSGKNNPSSSGVSSTPTPPPKPLYRADQLILPPEQFPIAGYSVTADAAYQDTGWRREFSPATVSASTPNITVVVSVLSASDAADPATYLSKNGICAGRSVAVLPTTDGGLISCQSAGMHDAAGHAGQIGTLVLSRPLGFGGFIEMTIVNRYLVLVMTTEFSDTSAPNGSLISRALLTVGQAQVAIIAKLAE
jgi:hypothetical protein